MVFVKLSRIILNVRNLLYFVINVSLSRIILDLPKNYYIAGLRKISNLNFQNLKNLNLGSPPATSKGVLGLIGWYSWADYANQATYISNPTY